MDKFSLIVVIGAVVVGVVVAIVFTGGTSRLGISTNDVSYGTVTNASTTCANNSLAGGTGTLMVAAAGRTSFEVDNQSANQVRICKATGCGNSVGISLSATGTAGSRYIQLDSYYGPWSCAGVGATATVNYFQSL